MTGRGSRIERNRRYRERQPDRFELRQRFLIVCEGEKTEPSYFRQFPLPPDSVIEVYGLGANTLGLVKQAVKLRRNARYAQVWCVFDRDSFPAENFNAALALAQEKDIHVAYSNEAFELWYVLHFEYLNSGISRKDYIVKLESNLGHPYAKNSESIYKELYTRQAIAIQNARKLLAEYRPRDPVNDNPSTTVHWLVDELKNLYFR